MSFITKDRAQKHFSSWGDFAKSYVIGRFIWSGGGQNDDEGLAHADDLVNKPNSPWQQVAW